MSLLYRRFFIFLLNSESSFIQFILTNLTFNCSFEEQKWQSLLFLYSVKYIFGFSVESSTSKMTPNILSTDSKILREKDIQNVEFSITKMIDTENYTQNISKNYAKTEGWFKTEPKWFNILYLGFLHLYFVYACFTFDFFENLMTTAWCKYFLKNSFVNFFLDSLIS